MSESKRYELHKTLNGLAFVMDKIKNFVICTFALSDLSDARLVCDALNEKEERDNAKKY